MTLKFQESRESDYDDTYNSIMKVPFWHSPSLYEVFIIDGNGDCRGDSGDDDNGDGMCIRLPSDDIRE